MSHICPCGWRHPIDPCPNHGPNAMTITQGLAAGQVQPFQAQAPICPFCYDDHSSLKECENKELKKNILIRKFDDFLNSIHNEKQDASTPDRIKDMIRWL